MPETLIFYVLSALAIGASALVVGQRNPMYSVLLLIASFGALAGLYIQLDAPFVAVAQIIIYAGAIMVLFLFVVMLLNAPQEDGAGWDRTHPLRKPRFAAFGALLAVLLVTQLGWAVMRIADLDAAVGARGDAATVGSVAELGRVLFQRHGFAFEATSILILVAMIGAVVLARREAPDQQGEAPDQQESEERP
jgi:NADH-quinone oxidoreductase subunit J